MRLFLILATLLPLKLLANDEVPLEFYSDVPASLKALAEQDINLLYQLKADKQNALHADFFGGPDGEAYHRYLRSQIRFIGFSKCGESGAAACGDPIFTDTTIWLTKNYETYSFPQIVRSQIYLHERKHLQFSHEHFGWNHIQCSDPYLDEAGQDIKSLISGKRMAGFYACDADETAAFGVGVSMLYNVAHNCTNCSEKVKQDALLYANEYSQYIIDPKGRERLRAP